MAPPSFAFDLMRTAVLGLAERHAAVRPLINPRQTHAIAYTQSPLNRHAQQEADAHPEAFARGPAPGTVLPECRLTRMKDGAAAPLHLTDLLGPCFTALRFVGEATANSTQDLTQDPTQDNPWPHLHHALAERGIPFASVTLAAGVAVSATPHVHDASGQLHAMLDATPGTVYLIRPDGHVLARWRNGSAADVQRAIDACLHLPPSA
jgi:3-(3-hydroxy-phenyl)propionate hydroxylase